MKLFASGTCRLFCSIKNGHEKFTPIHSMFHNFIGINFLGKLHNTKQHIQFLKFIKEEIILPDDILKKFFVSYGGYGGNFTECEDVSLIPNKIENLKREFDECEWYLFEICSLKLYRKDGFEIQFEVANEYDYILQTEEELLEDLNTIRAFIPSNKKILFQVHFRPNIIFNDSNQMIDKREMIYNVINRFCETNENTYLHDPSFLLQNNHSFFDGTNHFNHLGDIENFNQIYNNYILKYSKS